MRTTRYKLKPTDIPSWEVASPPRTLYPHLKIEHALSRDSSTSAPHISYLSDAHLRTPTSHLSLIQVHFSLL